MLLPQSTSAAEGPVSWERTVVPSRLSRSPRWECGIKQLLVVEVPVATARHPSRGWRGNPRVAPGTVCGVCGRGVGSVVARNLVISRFEVVV